MLASIWLIGEARARVWRRERGKDLDGEFLAQSSCEFACKQMALPRREAASLLKRKRRAGKLDPPVCLSGHQSSWAPFQGQRARRRPVDRMPRAERQRMIGSREGEREREGERVPIEGASVSA